MTKPPQDISQVGLQLVNRSPTTAFLVAAMARHSFGTYAMSMAKDPSLVREAMGHENLSTTMKYLHPDLSRLRDIIDQRNVAAMAQSMAQQPA